MKKVFLSLVAVLLCGVTFAQTTDAQGRIEISSAAEFLKIGKTNYPAYPANGNYILTADLNLGTYDATSNNFVISEFSGTFDGNDKTITYSGTFTTTADNQKIGLFGTNSGTIKNLNLDADITVKGNNASTKIGLLCGRNTGIIEFCDVTGNINSTATPGGAGNASTGLIIGRNMNILRYSTGHGNVTGIGYVGGLVGDMGSILETCDRDAQPLIRGCYFTGNVTANNSNSLDIRIGSTSLGSIIPVQSFGGGLCGVMLDPAKVELCVAEAIVVVGQNARGISNTISFFSLLRKGDANNNYCTGTVNGVLINDENIFNGGGENNLNTIDPTSLAGIVEYLNGKRSEEEEDIFYFDVINGKIVLVIGQEPTDTPTVICEAPTGLTVTVGENGTFTAFWSVNNQDNTFTTFRCSLTNNGETITQGTTTEMTLSGTLEPKTTPYILTVESDCSAEGNTLYSDAISYTFYVDANCDAVTGLQVTNITPTTANVSWTENANIVKLNGNEITFTNGQTLALSGLTPATQYTIEAIVNCTRHEEREDGSSETIPYQLSTTVAFVTDATDYVTAQSGNFNLPSTWVGGRVPDGDGGTTITIREGHRVNLDGTLVLRGTIINKGVLVIPQQGQLINTTENNDLGIVEIETNIKTIEAWTFVGAPFETGYKLGAVKPVSEDVAMVRYDYTEGKWKDNWAHVGNTMEAGEGVFAWPFYGGVITFSTHDFGTSTNSTYPENATATYALNNDDVTVTKNITHTINNTATDVNEEGNWMALANPYPAKLNVYAFKGANNLQGNCVYVFRNGSFDINAEDILMTEGFFVNFESEGTKSVTFNKDQLSYYYQPATGAKSSANELIELTLQNGNDKVRVYFAHNEDAEQGYDIFDANKMFATTGVAEPYFVTDGIALIKEEVAELPYYATMNVRSQQDTVMNFVLTNLPEGYAVSIIDGEEVIDMVEGGVYSTEILTGENADRFKVLVKKNVGLADVEELDVTIINSNRHITITAQEDVKVTVYNTLGQRVFETEKTDFVLSGVASGAYVVKVQGAKAAKSQKIIVE
ncbi:MAG: T9SS type A sorting domain-containing protein [Bacteroidales bacterium]|nr:T9SS type A sorting domain-containing protein [Bacteroidales bacterium]